MQKLKIIILLTLCCFSLSCSATSQETDAQIYWNKFRSASLTDNYVTLSQLIKFPLEVKGVTDDFPIKKYDKNRLNEIFPLLMSQTIIQYQGNNNYTKTRLQDIVKNTTVLQVSKTDTEFSVEQFNFQLINGKWYLVRVYLEE